MSGGGVAGQVVRLGPDDREDAWRLSALAFGADPGAPLPPALDPPPSDVWGVRDGRGRLVAKAALLDHEQRWGSRWLPAGGVAGVAVHPDARGGGTASALVGQLVSAMRERGQLVSALFPTVPGLYRRLGWEVVGALEETVLPTRALVDVAPSPLRVRTVQADEQAGVAQAYARLAGQGALRRTGRAHPHGPVPRADVVAVAEGDDGEVQGYVAYDRGRGYEREAELVVREMLSGSAEATRALLASVGRWHPVTPTTRWCGPPGALAVHLPGVVPPPVRSRPWMLRVVDPTGAVAARDWRCDVDVALQLVAADGSTTGHRLRAEGGQGALAPHEGRTRGPRLHVRGLALLWAGRTTVEVQAAGLLDGPLPGLDAALAGPPPEARDYF